MTLRRVILCSHIHGLSIRVLVEIVRMEAWDMYGAAWEAAWGPVPLWSSLAVLHPVYLLGRLLATDNHVRAARVL